MQLYSLSNYLCAEVAAMKSIFLEMSLITPNLNSETSFTSSLKLMCLLVIYFLIMAFSSSLGSLAIFLKFSFLKICFKTLRAYSTIISFPQSRLWCKILRRLSFTKFVVKTSLAFSPVSLSI